MLPIVDDIKLRACCDCKWFSRGDDGLTCENPNYKQFDVVNGWEAQQAKQTRLSGCCGITGKGWEPRNAIRPDHFVHLLGVMLLLSLLVWAVKGVFFNG